MKIVFIADFFVEQVLGGGELNNEELMTIFLRRGLTLEKIRSHMVTVEYLENNHQSKFIVANYTQLSMDARDVLIDLEYVIYEHDHQYLPTRNPADFENFHAPRESIINYDFYENAKAILCQSQFHADIMKKNLNLDHIVNLSGNIWSSLVLDYLEFLSKKEKQPKCSIMNSNILHKNTRQATRFCEYKSMDYELVSSPDYKEFLNALSNNKKFVFFPKTPETLSRVIIEARMCGMSVITNDLVGATKEPWYKLKGIELIEEVRKMRNRIADTVLEQFDDD